MSNTQIIEHHRKLQQSRNEFKGGVTTLPILQGAGYMEAERRSLHADLSRPLFTTDERDRAAKNLEYKRPVTP
jgi:hypothetical protein